MEIVITDPKKRSNPWLNRITVVKGDITHQEVDAIVTVLPQTLEYRGAINAAILRGAGEAMDRFVLENIYKPRSGDVYSVPGFNLPCRHIFFCIVPRWRENLDMEDRQLLNACRRAVETAKEMGLMSIAFPPIGSGHRAFSGAKAARLVLQGIEERLDQYLREVRIVCPDDATLDIFRARLAAMKQPR